MANLSSGNITFETLPTTGPETSANSDALATNPAEIKAFFGAIDSGNAEQTSAPETTVAAVDPASVTVDVQDGTIADGVTAHAADIVTKAGFTLGTLGVVPGTKKGHEQQTTEVQYGADGQGAAQQVLDAFGVGDLVPDDAVKSGHVLVLVGKDLKVPGSGLRSPGASFQLPAPVIVGAAQPGAAQPGAAQPGAAQPGAAQPGAAQAAIAQPAPAAAQPAPAAARVALAASSVPCVN